MRNAGLKYICKPVHVRVENADTPFTHSCRRGEVLEIPIGHMEGNYFCDAATLDGVAARRTYRIPILFARGRNYRRRQSQRLARQYRRHLQSRRNVLGMMPHPERASEAIMGGTDGLKIVESVVGAMAPEP